MAVLTLASTFTLASGHKLPILGLGVWRAAPSDCLAACTAAIEAGYRHIDSAIIYRNETDVGLAVSQSSVKREDLFITSKITSRYQGYDSTLRAVDESLARFKLDYLDLFLIHDPLAGSKKRLDTWRALIKKRDEGKLRSIGVSNYGVHHLEEIKKAGLEAPTVNQVEIHPWCQQRPIVEYCKKNSIVVEAYSPLTQGLHLNDPVLTGLAKKYNKDVAQILIRWSLQHGYSPLPKSSKPARVKTNADVYDFELSEDDMNTLNALDKGDAGATSWNPVNAP